MDRSGVIGIYLAAGKSRRMGINKLDLPFGKEWVGSNAFRAALESKLTSTVVVTRKGANPQWLAPFSDKKGWSLLETDGNQSSSLKAGIEHARKLSANGAVVLLADQPFVTYRMINLLLDEFYQTPDSPFIAFSNKGLFKPPMFISRGLFPEVMKLEGDQGARALIRGAIKGKKIDWKDDTCFFDVDTNEDYDFLKESCFKNRSSTPKNC